MTELRTDRYTGMLRRRLGRCQGRVVAKDAEIAMLKARVNELEEKLGLAVGSCESSLDYLRNIPHDALQAAEDRSFLERENEELRERAEKAEAEGDELKTALADLLEAEEADNPAPSPVGCPHHCHDRPGIWDGTDDSCELCRAWAKVRRLATKAKEVTDA